MNRQESIGRTRSWSRCLFVALLAMVTLHSLAGGVAEKVAALPATIPEKAGLAAAMAEAIEKAAPDQAPARPARPRKMLVYGRMPTHAESVPCCFKAMEILGRKTGAFEVVCTDDPAVFTREGLAQFDAVVMNNTHEHRPFLPPELLQWPDYKDKELDADERAALQQREETYQKNLLEFVIGGKGLVGIHGAVCMVHWPEYLDMFGGAYVGHFVEKVWVRPEEASHPLCADPQGQSFEVREELYRFGPPVFSRDKVRVLLSLDPSKFAAPTQKNQHPAAGNDYPISWIRSYGQGRVFYCSLGHMPEVFANPHVLRHFLAGIQFAIGDLKADTTPTGKGKVESGASHPRPGDVFREYSWTTEKFHVFSLKTNLFVLPAEVDLKEAIRAEVVVEIANQHMGFEGMAIRLNGNQWYPIHFPTSSPKDPSPSLWFHHWYPTIPIALTDLREGKENTFEMKVPAECFDGKIHPNGNQPLVPWCPLYGLTVRVYYDPARKSHPVGKVLSPAAQSTLALSADLAASAQSDNGPIRQVDFLGRYEDINYEGDGVYDQWHGHLFHGKITHHLGSTTRPDGQVTWDTSWVPDQAGPMEVAARITDSTGLIYITDAVGGLKLVRPGWSVELCKPFDVPRSFTGCQYGEWVISGIRTQKFTLKGDLSKAVDARYVIASWGNQRECPGYTINGVALDDKPAGADYYYNLSTPPIRPLAALKAGENTFATVVAKGRMPDIYMPGVQVLIRYRTGKANASQAGSTPGREAAAASQADWTTSFATGQALKRDGLIFHNDRWAGENGSIFVKYGPPTCTWWTTHEGPVDPYFPVSSPIVAFGNAWGNISDNSPLPIKLGDLEVLRASLSATLPGGTNGRLTKDIKAKQGPPIMAAGKSYMYRICWQLYFSDSRTGAKYNKGDFAPTVFAVNCSPTWWGSDAGIYEGEGRKWKMCDSKFSSGMGRYIIPLLDPYLTPDAEGKIEIRDVDIKAMIDWCIAKGFYRPEDYLVFASAAWEIWILDQNLKMNDMAFTIKQRGKPAVTIPAWSTFVKK